MIAQRAGVSAGLVIHHFGSKEALYGEVFERSLSDWVRRLEASIVPGSVGWSKVERVIGASFDFFADDPDFVRVMRREALDGGAHLGIDLAASLRPMFERAVAYFDREMDAGVFRRHDPEQLLLTGYGAVLSYFSDEPFIDGLLDTPALAADSLARRREHILSFFRDALVPSPTCPQNDGEHG